MGDTRKPETKKPADSKKIEDMKPANVSQQQGDKVKGGAAKKAFDR